MSNADSGTVPLAGDDVASTSSEKSGKAASPNETQLRWLQRGVSEPGGKLPLFDRIGQKVSDQTVRSCIRHGWAEPWFNNPIKPDWLICKLTDVGREVAEAAPRVPDETL